MPWLTESPNPVPFPTSLEVKNGSKIRFRFFSGMPQPVSTIDIATIGSGFGSGRPRIVGAASGDGDAALLLDRMLGVDQHVHDHLLDLIGVDPDRRQRAVEIQG